MPVTLSLPGRTWAALDAALDFFRAAPFHVEAAQRLSRHCRMLHRALQRAGVRSRYVSVAGAAPGRCLLRLHVNCCNPRHEMIGMELPRGVARSIAETCMAIIEVQTDASYGDLLDHEAEELQAARAFLSELRRQSRRLLAKVPKCYAHRQLLWDNRRREFAFTDRVGERVQQHYLRAGASLN